MIQPQCHIRTSYVHPPIPNRDWDWQAWIDGTLDYDFDGEGMVCQVPIGHGATECAAVADLLEQLSDRAD